MNIFGIKISNITKQEVFKKIDEFLADGKQHYLVTPNPEILLQASKDEKLFYILNQADIAIPDGIGLKFAGWFLGENLKRITGSDLVPEILKIAEEKNLKVGIVNWKKGLSSAKDIEDAMKIKYPKLNYLVKDVERENVETQDFASLQEFFPQILFVTLGAPFQEKFIFHNFKKMASARLAIGVGGSFDYLTGKARRAPKIMRNLGLEWLWRLFGSFSGQKGYSRKKRIFKASLGFPLKFIKWRFFLPFIYRKNVACLMYKKERIKCAVTNGVHPNEKIEYKIFIVKRQDARDEHWQLPQGGIDKEEDIFTAGERELSEEINNHKFCAVAKFKNLYKYKFTNNIADQRHQGYKGQRQSLYIAEFQGDDSDIKINYWDHADWAWIDADNFIDKVYYLRKVSSQIYLEKFNIVIARKPVTTG
jgi:N-acetylglucosaminyldiphosphoundecaprenol N-acetyl-beta-D-mannosaminyltransferase